jgi:hypothetical protein
MNPGKKLIRNTVLAMWGTLAFFVGWNRLYSSTLDESGEGTQFLTLGLRESREPRALPELDLAQARDFTQLSVRGPISVEVQGAPAFKVTFTPAAGQARKLRAWLQNGTLRVDAGDEEGIEPQGTLLVEVPTLKRIDLSASSLIVRGLAADELAVAIYRKGTARLEQNQVGRWRMFASEEVDMQVDDATFAAGALRTAGQITIRRAQ